MFRKFFLLVVMSLWGVVTLPVPERAEAKTPLTLAVIQNLRNLVQLMPNNQPKRQARKSDAMNPGDGLSTGRSALADLRFNDGSVALIGEQAIFRFLPKTRNFSLSNGTAVLLIPPGRGQTRINTPNAAAAIRGSALFVRYNQQTDTTIVGALTNSGIKVSNKDESQTQELEAGQLLVIVKGKFKGLYDFDLRTFYETSELVRGLNLPLKDGVPSSDPAIASVQAETSAAVAAQIPVNGQQVVENPSFVSPSPNNNTIRDVSPVGTLLETGQVVTNTGQPSNSKDNNSPSSNVGNKPPDNPGNKPSDDPKPTLPPSNTTPPSNSPTTTTPAYPAGPSSPPVTTPPVTTPPVTTPPVTTPPVTTPPVTTPPVTTPPVTTPPVTTPPVTTPPVTTPPVITPPVTTPPVTTPPVTAPTPADPSTPPVITPPVTTPTPADPLPPVTSPPAPPTINQPTTPVRPST